MTIELITKASLREKNIEALRSGKVFIDNPASVVKDNMGSRFRDMEESAKYNLLESAEKISNIHSVSFSGKYPSGFDVPLGKEKLSVNDRMRAGRFDPNASSNTLMPEWELFWRAYEISLTQGVHEYPYFGNFIFNENINLDATKIIDIKEMIDPVVIFEENNLEGQAVRQGELMGGSTDNVEHFAYTAGFAFTLLAKWYDKRLDMSKVSRAVTRGHGALRNDLALSPIINFSYSVDQQTAADTTSGAGRQELLYLTIENGIDDLEQRTDPSTQRKVSVDNLLILTNEVDARHISRVLTGFPDVTLDTKRYPAITNIRRIIGYDGETLTLNNYTVSYDGVPDKIAYLLKPLHPYMQLSVKRGLTAFVDPNPNVKTLTQEERAWAFAQGIWYNGIQYIVQEITLPAW